MLWVIENEEKERNDEEQKKKRRGHLCARIAPCGCLMSGVGKQMKVGQGCRGGLWSCLLCAKHGCVPAPLWRCSLWVLSHALTMPVCMPTCCLALSQKCLKYLVHLLPLSFSPWRVCAKHRDLGKIVKRWTRIPEAHVMLSQAYPLSFLLHYHRTSATDFQQCDDNEMHLQFFMSAMPLKCAHS